jgi:hypothetical protein
MTDEASLRRQLTTIKNKTANSITMDPGGWWVGDVAGERRVLDDLGAGRLAWWQAHNSAESGLAALEQGDLELAEVCLTNALWLYIDVLEGRVRPADMKILGKPSKRRGRPKK